MNGTWRQSEQILSRISALEPVSVEVLVCPPFTALAMAASHLAGTEIQWGAQNVYPAEKGAYTGEISPGMLAESGCTYCICGHSERRRYFGETDDFIHEKIKALFTHYIRPILCVGESADERAAGKTEAVIRQEVEKGIAGLSPDEAARLVIAYEPVWAIGSGAAATAGDAEAVCAFIRSVVEETYGKTVSDLVRILYGGSVNSSNISSFLQEKDIDGALIGGASLDGDEFSAIVETAERN